MIAARVRVLGGNYVDMSHLEILTQHGVIELARMIAKYEQPPADPRIAAMRQALNLWYKLAVVPGRFSIDAGKCDGTIEKWWKSTKNLWKNPEKPPLIEQ
jgi:hypothetical protein